MMPAWTLMLERILHINHYLASQPFCYNISSLTESSQQLFDTSLSPHIEGDGLTATMNASIIDIDSPAGAARVFIKPAAAAEQTQNLSQPPSASGPPEVAQLAATYTTSNYSKAVHACSGVDIIKLYSPSRATSTSSVTKPKQTRRALVNLHSDCPIDVEALLLWTKHFPDKDRVVEIIDRFPRLFTEPFMQTRRPQVQLRIPPATYKFLVPDGVLTSITSSLINWKAARVEQKNDDTLATTVTYDIDSAACEFVPVAMLATHGEFTRRYADVVKQIYDTRKVIKRYQEDLDWVLGDWTQHSSATVPFHDSLTMPIFPQMAQKVAQLLAEPWLTRKFTLRAGSSGRGGFVDMGDVVGRLAGNARLSDSVMHCSLQYLFSKHTALCYAVDPVHVENGTLVFPAAAMAKYAHVIVPVYMRSLKHWLIQVVSLPALTKAHANGHDLSLILYDPLGVESHINVLRTTWKEFTLPLLRAWHARDNEKLKPDDEGESIKQVTHRSTGVDLEDCSSQENETNNSDIGACSSIMPHTGNLFAPTVVEETLLRPKQSDFVSCGVLCLALAYSHVTGDVLFKQQRKVNGDDTAAMRLCIMWQILCDCDEIQDTFYSDEPDVQTTTKMISEYFKATTRSATAI